MKLKSKIKKISGMVIGSNLIFQGLCFADMADPGIRHSSTDEYTSLKMIIGVLVVIFIFGIVALYISNQKEKSSTDELTKEVQEEDKENNSNE